MSHSTQSKIKSSPCSLPRPHLPLHTCHLSAVTPEIFFFSPLCLDYTIPASWLYSCFLLSKETSSPWSSLLCLAAPRPPIHTHTHPKTSFPVPLHIILLCFQNSSYHCAKVSYSFVYLVLMFIVNLSPKSRKAP